ncbi:hypothetical protein OG592_41395 (plasmid) [Streptomyces avidinii]|uniref:hypothetical protein n=1 Tax=Streptomyces avidinii TaxID=1895 RepID=UPI002F9090CF|nr:hypothetical protein OG592_41395 [Streptomyces avidinii]
MRKAIYMTAVALLLAGTAPAYASGGADNGPVGVGVIGEGLKVKEVRALLQGWYPGARAEVFVLRSGKRVRTVGSWKATESMEVGGHKYELAVWPVGASFRHGDRLCSRFDHRNERPCVTIQR